MCQWMRFGMSAILFLGLASTSEAQLQLKLIGITGRQGNPALAASIFDIDVTDASRTFIRELIDVPRTNAIAWNPLESTLYHTSGTSSNSNDPTHVRYRDNHYMEAIDVYDYLNDSIINNGAITVKFNANPPPADSPPNDVIPIVGLPGPRPTWLLPDPKRTVDQTDDSFRVIQGTGEWFHARDLVWSGKDKAMFVTGNEGLFRYDPPTGGPTDPGDVTYLGQPADDSNTPIADEEFESKAVVFYHPAPGSTQLLVGMRNNGIPFGPTAVDILEMDPETAQFDYSNGIAVKLFRNQVFERDADGILALAQNPATGDLYGIEKNEANPLARPLIQFRTDPSTGKLTGNADIIGDVADVNATFSSFAFVGYMTGDMDHDGDVDFDDLSWFGEALGDPSEYETMFGWPSSVSGDTNGDGDHDFDDIPGFVDLLTASLNGPHGIPEASTVSLVALGLAGLACWGRRASQLVHREHILASEAVQLSDDHCHHSRPGLP